MNLSVDWDLRGAVDSQATTQISLLVDTDPLSEIFERSCCDATFLQDVWEPGNYYDWQTNRIIQIMSAALAVTNEARNKIQAAPLIYRFNDVTRVYR